MKKKQKSPTTMKPGKVIDIATKLPQAPTTNPKLVPELAAMALEVAKACRLAELPIPSSEEFARYVRTARDHGLESKHWVGLILAHQRNVRDRAESTSRPSGENPDSDADSAEEIAQWLRDDVCELHRLHHAHRPTDTAEVGRLRDEMFRGRLEAALHGVHALWDVGEVYDEPMGRAALMGTLRRSILELHRLHFDWRCAKTDENARKAAEDFKKRLLSALDFVHSIHTALKRRAREAGPSDPNAPIPFTAV